MRTLIVLSLGALLLAATLPLAGAEHECCTCPTYLTAGTGGIALTTTEVGVNPSLQLYVSAAKGTFYIVQDELGTSSWATSFWIYQEYNGAEGLQRHDDYCYTPGYNAQGAADLILW